MPTRSILLIDGDFEFYGELCQRLAPYGFEVHQAPLEDASLAEAKNTAAELVIIAVDLPNRVGFGICHKAKKKLSVPVVLKTSTLPPDGFTKHKKLKSHADAYLDKRTMSPEEFLGSIDALIGLGDMVDVPLEIEDMAIEVDELEVDDIEIDDLADHAIEVEPLGESIVLDDEQPPVDSEFIEESTKVAPNTAFLDPGLDEEADAAFAALGFDDSDSPFRPEPFASPELPEHDGEDVETRAAGEVDSLDDQTRDSAVPELIDGPSAIDEIDDGQVTAFSRDTPAGLSEALAQPVGDETAYELQVPEALNEDSTYAEDHVDEAIELNAAPEEIVSRTDDSAAIAGAIGDGPEQELASEEPDSDERVIAKPSRDSGGSGPEDEDVSLASEGPVEDEPAASEEGEAGPEIEVFAEADAPVEEAVAEEAPVEEAPVEEAPVEEAPVEEAPVEEAPVEEAPVTTDPEVLERMSALEAQNDEINLELETLRRENARVVSELEDAQKKAESSSEEFSKEHEFLHLREKINKKDKELLDAQDQITERDRELLNSKEQLRKLERARAELDDKNLELEQGLLASKESLSKFQKENESLESALSEALATAKAREAELKDEHKAELEAAEKEHLAHREEALRGANETFESKLQEVEESHQIALGEAKSESQRAMEALREEQSKALQALEDQHVGQLSRVERSSEEKLEEQKAQFDKAIEDLKVEHGEAIGTAQREHDEALQSAIASAEADKAGALEAAANERAQAEEEFGAKAAADREALVEQHNAVVANKDEEIEELKSNLSGLSERVENLAAELENAGAEIETRDKELESKNQIIALRDDRVDALKNEIAELEQQNAGYQEQILKAYQKIKTDEGTTGRAKKALAIALTLLDETSDLDVETEPPEDIESITEGQNN